MRNPSSQLLALLTVCGLLAVAFVAFLAMVPPHAMADCGSGIGQDPKDPPHYSPGCFIPWPTCACAASGVANGVACDGGFMCMHVEISNPKVDYYDIAPKGSTYPSFDTIARYCRLKEVECNPFGSPPCMETGDLIMTHVFEADFSFTDSCP